MYGPEDLDSWLEVGEKDGARFETLALGAIPKHFIGSPTLDGRSFVHAETEGEPVSAVDISFPVESRPGDDVGVPDAIKLSWQRARGLDGSASPISIIAVYNSPERFKHLVAAMNTAIAQEPGRILSESDGYGAGPKAFGLVAAALPAVRAASNVVRGGAIGRQDAEREIIDHLQLGVPLRPQRDRPVGLLNLLEGVNKESLTSSQVDAIEALIREADRVITQGQDRAIPEFNYTLEVHDAKNGR